MMNYKPRRTLAVLSALSLLTACKRDMVTTGDPLSTDARALTSKVANLNFLSGTPKRFAVDIDSVLTPIGGVGNGVFTRPVSIASDGSGVLVIADYDNNQVKVVAPGFPVPLATYGSGNAGFSDGSSSAAAFNHPCGVALGPDGIIYVADMGNNRIRAIDISHGMVSTFAGAGIAGFNDGTPLVAKFNHPSGVAVDKNGTVYVADQGNNMIRRIINKNSVTRWAGQLNPGSTDANGSLASFNAPRGIAVGPTGVVYVADMSNNKIRKITSGNVTTLAGSGFASFFDGIGANANFSLPSAVATDSLGNVYVTDQNNAAIRMVTPAGVVTTLAGHQGLGVSDGSGTRAKLESPDGIAVDPKGNIYITDENGPSIRKLFFVPAVKTAAILGLFGPASVAVGKDGTVYSSDDGFILQTPPAGQTISFAGSGVIGFLDGPVAQAEFSNSATIALAPDGTMYVADFWNNRIRKISGGVVSTLAGSGTATDIDGTGTGASFNGPTAIKVDASGTIYVGTHTGRICKVTPAGVVTTVNRLSASQGFNNGLPIRDLAIDAQGHRFVTSNFTVYEFTGDNKPALVYFGGITASGAPLVAGFDPTGIAVDAAGVLYLGETGKVTTLTPGKVRITLAGTGVPIFSGDQAVGTDGPVLQATFSSPLVGLVLGPNGVLYIADFTGKKIRMTSKL